MIFRLLLLFTLVPLVELARLLWVGKHIGLGATIGLVLLTGIVGASLARWQGVRTLRALQDELAAGRMPTNPLMDGAMILVAAALLVTPGVLTDLVGLALLLPPVRALARGALKRWARGRIHIVSASDSAGGEVIDVEALRPGEPKRPAGGGQS